MNDRKSHSRNARRWPVLGEDRSDAGDPAPRQQLAQGAALWEAGRRDEAIAVVDAALANQPVSAAALAMAGYFLGELGKPEVAVNFYRRSLALDESRPDVWSNLGKLLFADRQYGEALAAFDTALRVDPDEADFWCSRSGALRKLGRLVESAEAASRALELRPRFAEAAINLGNACLKLGRTQDALDAYSRSVLIDPDLATGLCGMALALRALGRFEEALEKFRAAEKLGCVEATSGKGCLLLSLGHFEAGWEGYEKRWFAGRSMVEALGVRFPTWEGPANAASRVVVLNDHGLGDTIQFYRYLPMMKRLGVDVAFACPPALHDLLRSPDGPRLIDPGAIGDAFDRQIALSSLPRAFGTRLDSVPAEAPYLRVDAALAKAWGERLGAHGFKIGIAWNGNPDPEADMARSMPLAEFSSLAKVAGTRLVSLQKGFGSEQLEAPANDFVVEVLGGLDSGGSAFLDTAAVMANLDLVVTCDTSIAHLAGALGRPVWVALKKDAEWRWLIDRSDSPWYPTMRLFRQREAGCWRHVFETMAAALQAIAPKPSLNMVSAPTSIGEVVDKITILEIKSRRIHDPAKLENVRGELRLLEAALRSTRARDDAMDELGARLALVNETLWDIENDVRDCELRGDFGEAFVALARAVYRTNDARASLKRKINLLAASAIVEEKSYG